MPRIELGEPFTVKPHHQQIALERTGFLLNRPERPLTMILANAYLCGVLDAAEAMIAMEAKAARGEGSGR